MSDKTPAEEAIEHEEKRRQEEKDRLEREEQRRQDGE